MGTAIRICISRRIEDRAAWRGRSFLATRRSRDFRFFHDPTATISTPFVSSLDSGVTPRDRLANPFPNGLIPLIGRSQGLDTLVGQSVGMFIRGAHQGYVNQWNFDVQQQLGGGLAVEAAYAGSHGVGLPASIQANQIPDAYLNLGTALNEQVSNPFYGLVSVGTLSQRTVS